VAELRLCGRAKDDGAPCGYRLNGDRQCPWHRDGVTAEDRQLVAAKGGLASRWKTLPPDAVVPTFRTREDVVRWAEEHAALVLKGELHPTLAAEARQMAALALQAHELAALERLDRLERVVVKGRRLA